MSKADDATDAERELLADWLAENVYGGDREPAEIDAEQAAISVIRDYSSSGPGFTGDIMTVVYGSPEMHDVFTVDEGKLEMIVAESQV